MSGIESAQATLEYFKEQRRKAFYESDPRDHLTNGWTEEQWIEKAYHWAYGTKVYHSYADYCDD